MAFKVTKWLPEDPAVLAAIGRIAVRHGQLNYCLRMTVKSLEGVSVGDALPGTEWEGSRKLSKRIKRIARAHFGDGDVLKWLEEILNRSRLVTERRNDLLHGLWCQKLDGEPGIRTDHEFQAIPTIAELDDLANTLDQVTDDLNSARLKLPPKPIR